MIGIMQGRLVPPEGGRLQSFPRERWKDEFSLAKAVPLEYIEWIFDAYGQDVNPIYSDVGISTLRGLIDDTGIRIQAVCADYFMDAPLIRCTPSERDERLKVLHRLIHNASRLGVRRITLPFVDASRIETGDDIDIIERVLEVALPNASEHSVEIHLETSLAPGPFAELLARLPHEMLRVNYDSGNSSSLGYDPAEEFAAYGHRIGSVHIKDRRLGGSTVPLGTGNTCFSTVFQELRRFSYRGDFTLQVARGEVGRELTMARENLNFVRQRWDG